MRSLSFSMAVLPLLLLSLLFSSTPAKGASLGEKWEATSFCKCICFSSNYTILHLVTPDNPSKPCLSCTKQWCINQNLPICQGASLGDTDPDTATGKEGDVEARCFQRDSPRDQLVVTLFLLTVFGLLLGAGIKGKMVKAGIDFSIPWSSGRRWWETWNPRAPLESISLSGRSPFARRLGDGEGRRGDKLFAVPRIFETAGLRGSLSLQSFHDVHVIAGLRASFTTETIELALTVPHTMGSLCSKSGTHSGGHTVLGSSSDHRPAQASPRDELAEERRARMAQAAIDRQQKDMERLTNKKNPNAGRLASQVNKPVKATAQERQDEPLRWD